MGKQKLLRALLIARRLMLAGLLLLALSPHASASDDDHEHKSIFPYFTDFEKKQHAEGHDNENDKEHDDNPHEQWKTAGWWQITHDSGRRNSSSGSYHLDNNPKEKLVGKGDEFGNYSLPINPVHLPAPSE